MVVARLLLYCVDGRKVKCVTVTVMMEFLMVERVNGVFKEGFICCIMLSGVYSA